MDQGKHATAIERLDEYSLHAPEMVTAVALLSLWQPHAAAKQQCRPAAVGCKPCSAPRPASKLPPSAPCQKVCTSARLQMPSGCCWQASLSQLGRHPSQGQECASMPNTDAAGLWCCATAAWRLCPLWIGRLPCTQQDDCKHAPWCGFVVTKALEPTHCIYCRPPWTASTQMLTATAHLSGRHAQHLLWAGQAPAGAHRGGT